MAGNLAVGISGVALASLVWGSCFIVCKGYDLPNDGIHFSFLMSIGILLVGILSLFSSAMEDGDYEAVFSPCGLLGGALWACGNFLTVPIIQCIGLGVGLAIWAGVNMIVAFLVGAMGMEGVGVPLPKEALSHPASGVFGVLCALCALGLFTNVKSGVEESTTNVSTEEASAEANIEAQPTTNGESRHTEEHSEASQPLLEHLEVSSSPNETTQQDGNLPDSNQDLFTGNVPLGVAMAVTAGVFYGFQMVPLSIWNIKVDHNGHIFDQPLPSDILQALRFFFSQFAGIFLTAMVGFVFYCLYTKNEPKLVPPQATLPSIICGMVWACGAAGAMFATSELGNAVGYVLVLNCSFLINSAWSILVFREIQGKRNLQLFGGAFLLNVVSSLLISISKV